MSFHALLRAKRHQASVSQRELAERSGLSLAAVRDLEQGRTRRPHPRSVRALITALGLTGDDAAELLAACAPVAEISVVEGAVRVGVLGPLTVHRGHTSVSAGRGKRRVLLGRLALSPGAPVAVDELLELVGSVQPYVSRLRALVPLELVAGGYRLCLPDVDLLAFRRLVAEAGSAAAADAFALLADALALWRGPVLADVPELHSHPLVATVEAARVDAALSYGSLALTLGRAAEAVPSLRSLLVHHPLHEPLHAKLIGVLGAASLHAEALAVFDAVRRRLADELGIDPGSELVDAHRRLLRAEPPRSVPAQLPLRVPGFVGRVAELAALSAPVVVVSGTGGVGKTTLVVEWAHRMRSRFPDGQLYVNLRGFDPVSTPMPAAEALHGFLEALGVAPAQIPAGVAARSARLRSLLADRRVLLVLDNARDAEQVRPLLPGASGCQVVVTSRVALTGLVAVEGAVPVALSALSSDEAAELLALRQVPAVSRGDMLAVCAGLPLALAIAAARGSCSGLSSLSSNDPRADIRTVFSWSVGALSEPAERLFRLLGRHPGPNFAAPAAASLFGSPADAALAELVEASLVSLVTPGRYAMHDLVREYAASLTSDPDAPLRLWDHYLHTARDAAMLLQPNRGPFELDPISPGAAGVALATLRDAWSWFTAERQVLTSVALSSTSDSHVWQLSRALVSFFNYRGLWDEAIPLHTAALEAGVRAESVHMQAFAHRSLAGVYGYMDRDDEADHHYDRAITMFAALDDGISEAHARMNFAWLLSRRGKDTEALTHYEHALSLYRACGHQHSEARALNAIGFRLGHLDRAAEGLACCMESLALMEQLSDTQGMAVVLDSLGFLHHQLGSYGDAVAYYERAVPLFVESGDQHSLAATFDNLGDTHSALGDQVAARAAWRRAVEIFEGMHHQDAEAVRAKL